MNNTSCTELLRKLHAIGTPPEVASKEVMRAITMSPTNGAEHLKQRGLDYLECFKLLSVRAADQVSEERAWNGSRLKNPALLIVAGGVMVLIGGCGVMRGLSVHSNAVIIDHGITLCLGVFFCVWTVIKSVRK